MSMRDLRLVLLNASDILCVKRDDNFVLCVLFGFPYVFGGWRIASVVWWRRMMSVSIVNLSIKSQNCMGAMALLRIVASSKRQVTRYSDVLPRIDSSDIGGLDQFDDEFRYDLGITTQV